MTNNIPYLAVHRDTLAALRFCPMKAPAAETAAVTFNEAHATRARAVMLWRIAAGLAPWTLRSAELIYETTLDSMSEAFDVYHAPMSQIMLDARADAFDAGFAPAVVRAALDAERESTTVPIGERAFLAAEAARAGTSFVQDGEAALRRMGVEFALCAWPSGAVAFILGDRRRARQQVEKLAAVLSASGATEVICDGPETFWALTRLPAILGVSPWAGAVASIADVLAAHGGVHADLPRPAFVHDARIGFWLAETKPTAAVVAPGADTRAAVREEISGDGAVYRATRDLVDRGGGRVWSVWSRGLAKSCGSDDGLCLTYPHIADDLARARFAHARDIGAASIATDSATAAAWLVAHRRADDPAVFWLPAACRERTS